MQSRRHLGYEYGDAWSYMEDHRSDSAPPSPSEYRSEDSRPHYSPNSPYLAEYRPEDSRPHYARASSSPAGYVPEDPQLEPYYDSSYASQSGTENTKGDVSTSSSYKCQCHDRFYCPGNTVHTYPQEVEPPTMSLSSIPVTRSIPFRSKSEPAKLTQKEAELNICIFDAQKRERIHVALMDTCNENGLKIAKRVVDQLGFRIHSYNPPINARVGNDTIITSEGEVELTFKLLNGKRTITEWFYVFDWKHFDVILDLNFLRRYQVLGDFDLTSLIPLVETRKESAYHEQERQKQEQEQKEEAQRSAERKERRQKEKEAAKKRRR